MKALSIRQPWASMICAGIRDVDNRTWSTNYRGKLLIHVSGKVPTFDKLLKTLPLEWTAEIVNQSETFGQLPMLQNMPTGAIIGYVDLVDCVRNSSSEWAASDTYQFVFKNAHLFDSPISGVKGKLNLFDVDLDENNLPPSHRVEVRGIKLCSGTLAIPVFDVDDYTGGEESMGEVIQISQSVVKELLTEDGDIKEIKKVVYTDVNGKVRKYKVNEAYITFYSDNNDQPVMVNSFYSPDPVQWQAVTLELSR